MSFQITYPKPHTSQWDSAREIYKKSARYLGLFPDGAWEQCAEDGRLLCATTPDGVVAGYLIYRVVRSRDEAVIVHLSVDPVFLHQGCARALVDALTKKTIDLQGISLSCRRDWPAIGMWPKLGFVAVGERQGRGRDQAELTRFRYDHGHPHLFNTSTDDLDRVPIVIDANVFFDFVDETDDDACKESAALQASWLEDIVALYVTKELLNEINRKDDVRHRERERARARSFPELHFNQADTKALTDRVEGILGPARNEQDASDIRQVAQAIAAGAAHFVTRDTKLLRFSDELYAEFAISVLRPLDLILRLDRIEREFAYRPTQLAGSTLECRAPCEGEIDAVAQRLLRPDEKLKDFRLALRHQLAGVDTSAMMVCHGEKAEAIAVWSRTSGTMKVTHFRVRPGPLASTLAIGVGKALVERAVQDGIVLLEIADVYAREAYSSLLRSIGFLARDDSLLKVSIKDIVAMSDVPSRLAAFREAMPQALRRTPLDVATASQVEHLCWPLKINDAEIPTFIVPIKAVWALELFDFGLADQHLYPTEIHLALNAENVYYRSARQHIFKQPGRILWYVSHDRNYEDVKMVRACSRLDDVSVGLPKDLFKQNRRLGIYRWEDVKGIVDGDLDKPVMSLRFSDTELFKSPIPLAVVQENLQACDGTRTTFQSPIRISPKCFAALYELGSR